MFQATIINTGAMLANGIWDANGANSNSVSSTNKPWMTPDILETAPDLILVAVRAIAPVAGIPPKNGVTIFAIPCPISSLLLLCFVPDMASATTAESNDSIPPNTAIAKAGTIKRCIRSQVISGR